MVVYDLKQLTFITPKKFETKMEIILFMLYTEQKQSEPKRLTN